MTQRMDKRKFYRLPYPLNVLVEIVTTAETLRGIPARQLHGRNISKEGICLETETLEWNGISLLAGAPCARQNRLRMTLLLEPEGSSLTAIGEVRWYDVIRDEGGCLYQLGIEFLDIREGGKEQLLRFLKNHRPKGIIQKIFG